MFHTNYVHIEREYKCDDGCKQNGDCPSHKMELLINNTVGVAELKIDGDTVHWYGCNDADALYDMFKQIKDAEL